MKREPGRYFFALGSVVDVQARSEVWQFDDQGILALHQDDERFFVIDAGGTLRAKQLSSGVELWNEPSQPQPDALFSMGDRFVTVHDGALRVVRAATGQLITEWRVPTGGVEAITGLQSTVAILSSSRRVHLYDVDDGLMMNSIDVEGAPLTSPDLAAIMEQAKNPLPPGGTTPTVASRPALQTIDDDGFLVTMARDDGTWVSRVNVDGKRLWSRLIEKKHGNPPELRFASANVLGFSAQFREPFSAVVDAKTGSVLSTPNVHTPAFVFGSELFLIVPEADGSLALLRANGERVWRREHLIDGWMDGNHLLSAILHENTLVVAVYRRVDPTTELFAVDVRSGAPLWTGELAKTNTWVRKQMHPNLVMLESLGDAAIVTIDQPKGLAVQIFDTATGKRWWEREQDWQ